MTRRITRSEVAWRAAILAVSAALFALTGRPSTWNLATGLHHRPLADPGREARLI